ncbi:MAG: hypothetical protein HXX81_01610, partial [Campylobacterales bacterium]|nr:hypothetical protein [Campylobacterales bacterium]
NFDTYPKGWSLLGNSKEITIKEIKDKNPEIKYIYQYRQNSWYKNDNDIINSGDGYWIYKKEPDFNQSINIGWNLLSLPVNKVTSIEKYQNADLIYTFENGEYIKNPAILKPYIGFWLQSNVNQTIGFYGTNYELNSSLIKSGWNLLGGKISSIKDLKSNDDRIEKVYIFQNGNYISDDLFEKVDAGVGIWIFAN